MGSNPGPFCVESACPPHAYLGFLRVLRFPPTIKDVNVSVNNPVSAPDQGTGKRPGVGPQVLDRAAHCSWCVWLKLTMNRMDQMQRFSIPKEINKVTSSSLGFIP